MLKSIADPNHTVETTTVLTADELTALRDAINTALPIRVIAFIEGGNLQQVVGDSTINFDLVDDDNWECVFQGIHDNECSEHTKAEFDQYMAHSKEIKTLPVEIY